MLDQRLDKFWPNYIDGEYCQGGAGSIKVYNPGTGLQLATQALADSNDVNRAVQAARRVHLSGEFANLHPMERGKLLRKMGDFIVKNADEVKRVLVLEQGKPWFEADTEVKQTIRFFEYFASVAESLEGYSAATDSTRFDFTVYRPYGVSAHFIPSHYPVYIPARSLAVALAAGNCCVLKTSELTPLSAIWFARAAEHAGLPNGVLNILCGKGNDAGHALAAHPDINHLVMSGNVETATKILQASSQHIVPSLVEVGGTNPTIVFEDVNMDIFISEARTGSFWNAGQFCGGMYRIIVHESRYDELVERSIALAESLKLVPSFDTPRTEAPHYGPYMGPMDSEEQLAQVVGMVQEAVAQGAKCVTGGERVSGPGSFMRPTVVLDARPEMRIAQREIWGPVMLPMKFKTMSEAISIANSTPYSGLLCGVFTQDAGRILRTAQQVRAAHVIMNASVVSGPEVPFGGGFGRTGYGKIKGRVALQSYAQEKNILLPIDTFLPETVRQTKAWLDLTKGV